MDIEKIRQFVLHMKNILEGATFSVPNDNLEFIDESVRQAHTYEWIYHCTSASAALNILRSKELWLSNLQKVNDKNEAERIKEQMFRYSVYVGSFTYDPALSREHWKEYGSLENGVLLGIRPSSFVRKAYFLRESNEIADEKGFYIYDDKEEVGKAVIDDRQKDIISNHFYIYDFDFYKVVYDDEMFRNIYSEGAISKEGRSIPIVVCTPNVAGIIKQKSGMCAREGIPAYPKNWEEEKEARLKVTLCQTIMYRNGNKLHDGLITIDKTYFCRIAVPMREDAFDIIQIGFSPDFKDRDGFIANVKNILPNSNIIII